MLLVVGCGDTQPLPDIDATVEARVQAVAKATALSIPAVTPVPTVAPITTATSKPVPPTVTPAEDEIEEGVTCTLNGGEVVQKGWSGKDTGANYCNQCVCLNVGLACTKMACPSVKVPATSTPVPPTSTPTQVPPRFIPTPTQIPPTSTPTSTLTPTPTATPTPTDLSDSIECTVSEHSLNVSCKAPRGISGQWVSNATTRTLEGSTFEFSIESQVSEIVVELTVCVANDCHVVTAYIEPPPLDALRAEEPGEQEVVFWNERPSDIPKCTTDFRFSHQLANPEVVARMMFGPGSHIEPHEHMLYWESGGVEGIETVPGKKRQVSRKIQLYAPADIYRIHVGQANRTTEEGDTYVEWGGYLYTCDGHQLMLGHIGEPSDEIKAILAETEPTCDQVSGYAAKGETECVWVIDTFISSGTPIFKSSGYAGAFDFGLSLFGLTAEQLQEQPGYGYSITPWRVSSGRAVCPLEYFPEPLRSEYLKRLRDSATGELFECGPFNQDVPGTAMGFWLPSPSPETPPMDPSEAFEDEWETIWLFQSNNDPSIHILSVGNNTFGLDYGQYQISTVSEGLVNRRWDAIKPGDVYCAEFTEAQNEESELTIEKTLILRLSEDGTALTVEAINIDKCGGSPWEFQGGERTFYR